MAPVLMTLFLASMLPSCKGHGMITKPLARQMLVGSYENGVGLTDPGAEECDISVGNGANLNGCQGGCPFNPELGRPDCGDGWQPRPRVGVCGGLSTEDVFAVPEPAGEACKGVGDGTPSCVKQALRSPRMSILEVDSQGYFALEMKITAHHWGWSEFRLCIEGEGLGPDPEIGVTQECFNEHVLTFDTVDAAERYNLSRMEDVRSRPGCFYPSSGDECKRPTSPSDYQILEPSTRCDGPGAPAGPVEYYSPDGSCCLDGGDCGNSSMDPNQDIRWVLPRVDAAEAAIGGGPSNVPGAEPMNGIYTLRLKLPSVALTVCETKVCTLQWLYVTGNSPAGYPEAFRNCADFKIARPQSRLLQASFQSTYIVA